MLREDVPRGRDETVKLAEAARRYRMAPADLRERLRKAEWIRLSRLTWASLAGTRLVTLRHYDSVDGRDRPVGVRS